MYISLVFYNIIKIKNYQNLQVQKMEMNAFKNRTVHQ